MKTDQDISARQRNIVDELSVAKAALKMRDKEFFTAFLPGDYWTWLNARARCVGERTLAGYELALREIAPEVQSANRARERARASALPEGVTITKSMRRADAILKSLLAGKNTEHRCLMVLGVTGSGKTALRNWIHIRHGGEIIRATESYRTAFAAIHLGVQSAFGSRRYCSTRVAIEQHTFNLLNATGAAPLIQYDEGLRLGASAINVLHDIHDLTPAIQIVYGVPGMIDRLSGKAFQESSQFLRRNLEVVEIDELSAGDDLRPRLENLGLNGSSDAVAKELAKRANEYGRWDLVLRVEGEIARTGTRSAREIIGYEDDRTKEAIGIIPDEVRALRVQRMTERMRAGQEQRRRKSIVRFADALPKIGTPR